MGHKRASKRRKKVKRHEKVLERNKVNGYNKATRYKKVNERCSRTRNVTKPEPNIQTPDKKQPLHIVKLDTNGDLILKIGTSNIAYEVSSHVLRRASPCLYEQCLRVRPADGAESTWMFTDMPRTSDMPASTVLTHIHGDPAIFVREPETVFEAVQFTVNCGMFDYCLEGAKEWYQHMHQASTKLGSTYTSRHICRLWLAVKLSLDKEVIALQEWAIFALDRKLGDPPKRFDKLSVWCFDEKPEEVVKARIINIRADAVRLVLEKIQELQLAIISTNKGPVTGFGGSGCEDCRNRWFSGLSRVLLRPEMVDSSLNEDFPRLFPMIEPDNYHRSLEQLCCVVERLQEMITSYCPESKASSCSEGKAQRCEEKCVPPRIVGREAVEDLVRLALRSAPVEVGFKPESNDISTVGEAS